MFYLSRRRLSVCVMAVFGVLAMSCSSGEGGDTTDLSAQAAEDDELAPERDPSPSPPYDGDSTSDEGKNPGEEDPQAGTDGSSPAPTGDEEAESASGTEDSEPADEEGEPPDIEAVVEPTCVLPEGSVNLLVRTAPRAGVAYEAIYSDGNSGAGEPAGEGYGGNQAGFSDDAGEYRSSWTVSSDAPTGPGEVRVVVLHDGQRGEERFPFEVGDPAAGGC